MESPITISDINSAADFDRFSIPVEYGHGIGHRTEWSMAPVNLDYSNTKIMSRLWLHRLL